MKFVWLIFALVGVWCLISAATLDGLMPSGHGSGRVSEVIEGVLLIAIGLWRLLKK